MTRFMTTDPRNSRMHAVAQTMEAPCAYAHYMNNNAIVITMGTSTLVSIFVIMAAILRLYQMVLIYIISIMILSAIMISIIYLSRPDLPPKETSDLS